MKFPQNDNYVMILFEPQVSFSDAFYVQEGTDKFL